MEVLVKRKVADFICPKCDKPYHDDVDKVYSRGVDASGDKTMKMQCSCGYKFYITKNYLGKLSAFRLNIHDHGPLNR